MQDAAALELELKQQLEEQIDALSSINEALAAGHDDELIAVKLQLEEAIPALQASLKELQQHSEAYEDVIPVLQQQNSACPEWLTPGALCRFRAHNGQWYYGVVDSWQPQQQMPVQVHFRYPTRSFMLQPLQLPLGLVLADGGSSSSSSSIAVGSRVLALVPGQQLWQQAEITTVSKAAAAAAAAGAGAGTAAGADISSSSCCCTVVLVETGQSMILPTSSITTSAMANVSHEELDSAAAAAACTAASAAIRGGSVSSAGAESYSKEQEDDADSSDMSISGEEAAEDEEAGSVFSASGSDSGSEGEEEGDEEQDQGYARVGLGLGGVMEHARLAAEAGVQTDTATFADWENHSRGIASKLLARMGFKRGGGLGKTGSGISNPLEITILPSKKGLGAVQKHKIHKAHGTSNKKNKHRNRGGERTRRRKAAAARHAAKAVEGQQQLEAATGSEGLFAFINHSLGAGSEAADRLRDAGVYGYGSDEKQQQQQQQQQQPKTGGAAALASAAAAAGTSSGRGGKQQQQQRQQLDRKGLVGSQKDLAAIQARVSQLTAMLARNKTNKGLAPQIEAKLAAAKRELEAAAAQHRQLHKAVARKEAAEKMIKF